MSDGTAAGTGLVKTLNPNGDAQPFDFTAFGGALYFAANDGTNGTQLWKTDGTPGGTSEVTVLTGPFGTNPYVPTSRAQAGRSSSPPTAGSEQRRDRGGHRRWSARWGVQPT